MLFSKILSIFSVDVKSTGLFAEDKILLRSQIMQGMGNVNDILQKLETGELAMDGDPIIIENEDGTVSVKMIVKPR